MEREIIYTGDGSHSICIPGMNVTYHSIHGAIQESRHVFIEAGLHYHLNKLPVNQIAIFEMGFGTGLNALLTSIEAERLQERIYYETVELFPLHAEQASSLNYCEVLNRRDLQTTFDLLHHAEWGKDIYISDYFTFSKTKTSLVDYQTNKPINIIYFDAFDPVAQPELWTVEIFQKMFSILQKDGILVTYSSKGSVRRAMQAAGFKVEKIPGPRGKREITRALKSMP